MHLVRSSTPFLFLPILFFLSMTHSPSPASPSTIPWTVEDLTRHERIADRALSRDGAIAAWVKTEVKEEDGEASLGSDLYLARFEGGSATSSGEPLQPIRLTHTQSHYANLEFSPDSKHLVFTSDRESLLDGEDDEDVEGSQVWVLPLLGGEARRVTSFDSSVSSVGWIDEKTLLVSRVESKPRRLRQQKKRGDVAQAIEDVRERPAHRLFRVSLDGDVKPLGRNTDWIDEVAVSPAGNRAVVRAQQSLSYAFDEKIPPKVFLVDLSSGERTEVLGDSGLVAGVFRWAPDGTGFYFLDRFSNHPLYRNATVNHLYRYDLESGEAKRVDLGWERGLSNHYAVVPSAQPDGEQILGLLENGTSYRPAVIDVSGVGNAPQAAVRDLVYPREGDFENLVASSDGSRLLYVASTANLPQQLYSASLEGEVREQQLGTLNESFADKPTNETEVVRWIGAEGDEVEGLLHYPLDWNFEDPSENEARPLVLDIHGGPTGVDRDRWDSNWASPNILWRQRGAFVFQVNYHGSGGYGVDWAESIEKRYYELELPDIERGVDALIEQGLVDPDRLATTGWSNGGILSAGLIVDTERYKAAIVGAADVEWISDWGNVAFGASFDNYYFGGPPWERLEHYIEKSPYFKLTNVTTPTLVHTGDADTNVPPSQSWSLFRALQQIGKTDVRFVLYPGEPHGLRKIAHQERKLREDLAWLDRYVFETHTGDDYLTSDPALPEDSRLAALIELRDVARRDDGALGRQVAGRLVPEVTSFGGLEVGRFELTRAQLAAMTGDRVPEAESNLPASVDFEQAQRYVEWLSEHTGETYRLPTAKEAKKLRKKGGNTLDRWLGYEAGADDLAKVREHLVEQFGDDWSPLLVPVDQAAAHRGGEGQALVWGLGGNVAEWSLEEEGKGTAAGRSADRPADSKDEPKPAFVGLRVVRQSD